MIPTPEPHADGMLKIYFSGRNNDNQSHIGWAIIDLDEPHRIVAFSPAPVLAPGELGCFDDNGVTPSCVVKVGERIFLYYIGWNPRSSVRMSSDSGRITPSASTDTSARRAFVSATSSSQSARSSHASGASTSRAQSSASGGRW